MEGYLCYADGGQVGSDDVCSKLAFFEKHIDSWQTPIVDFVNSVIKLYDGVDIETVRIFMSGDIWVDLYKPENLSRYSYFMGIRQNPESGLYEVCLFMSPVDSILVLKVPRYYQGLISCLKEEDYADGEDMGEGLEGYPEGFRVSAVDTVEDIIKREKAFL